MQVILKANPFRLVCFIQPGLKADMVMMKDFKPCLVSHLCIDFQFLQVKYESNV